MLQGTLCLRFASFPCQSPHEKTQSTQLPTRWLGAERGTAAGPSKSQAPEWWQAREHLRAVATSK